VGASWAKVNTLSGGERSRLLFVGLTLARYSLLMLDEPTNHLDMEGKEALADTLQQFEGGVLLVSHDRQLISQSCNRFWLIEDGKLSEWHDADAVFERLRESSGLTQPVDTALPQTKHRRRMTMCWKDWWRWNTACRGLSAQAEASKAAVAGAMA
jgi:ATPase subunit of ABC transporter with duplicated ATPase domains